MAGEGIGGVWDMPDGVTVWDNETDLDTLANLGSAFVAPVFGADPFRSGRNNLAAHMAKSLRLRTGRPVRVIIVAMGGKEMSDWHNGSSTGAMWARMEAILSAAGVSEVDALAWHQGEADDATGSGTYADKFDAMIDELHSEGIMPVGAPVIIGTPNNQFTNINPVLTGIAAARSDTTRVDIRDLDMEVDDIHFTGTSLAVAGQRYEQALADALEA